MIAYFDHTNPDWENYNTFDNQIAIYTTERGLETNNCGGCYVDPVSGITICEYYTKYQDQDKCETDGPQGRLLSYDMHPAIDYAFPEGEEIVATAPGTAYQNERIGHTVAIDHGNGYWTLYGHLQDATRIAHGSSVVQGQPIGRASNSGTADVHLHFEFHRNGEFGPVFDPYGWWGTENDPDPWFNQPGTQDWWVSADTIPMGYRNQDFTVQGPFVIDGPIGDKWRNELDGLPGSPLEFKDIVFCYPFDPPDECQHFEKGYIRRHFFEDGSSTTEYTPYGFQTECLITFVPGKYDTVIGIHNGGYSSAQVSVLFVQNGHVIDSITSRILPAGADWIFSAGQALSVVHQDLGNPFYGSIFVYSDYIDDLVVVAVPSPEFDERQYLPLVANHIIGFPPAPVMPTVTPPTSTPTLIPPPSPTTTPTPSPTLTITVTPTGTPDD